jgi:hypothetical protein
MFSRGRRQARVVGLTFEVHQPQPGALQCFLDPLLEIAELVGVTLGFAGVEPGADLREEPGEPPALEWTDRPESAPIQAVMFQLPWSCPSLERRDAVRRRLPPVAKTIRCGFSIFP